MVIIAITDDTGTQSSAIAARLSRRLNLAYLVERHHGLARGEELLQGPEESRSATGVHRIERCIEQATRFTTLKRLILEAVQSGNVLIRGPTVPAILRHVKHVLRAHVWASDDARIREIMRACCLDDYAAAAQLMNIADAGNARFIEDNLGPIAGFEPYHIALNSELISVEQCVEQICQLAASSAFRSATALNEGDREQQSTFRNCVNSQLPDVPRYRANY